MYRYSPEKMPREVTAHFDAIRRNRIARRLMRQLQGLWTQRMPNHKRSFMTNLTTSIA